MSFGEFVPRPSSTKLYVKLNGSASDSSGNSLNGVGTGITYSRDNGKFERGAKFGTAKFDGIDFGTNNALNFTTSPFTISMWLNHNLASLANPILFCKGIYRDSGYYCQVYSGAGTQMSFTFIVSQFGANQTQTCNLYLPNNKWGLFTVVRDGASVKMFLDGRKSTSTPVTIVNPGSSAAYAFVLGNYSSKGAIYAYGGKMDEVIVENRAWSEEEVKKYYTNSSGRFGV